MPRQLGIVLLIALLILAGGFAVWRIRLAAAVRDRFTALRAAGFPASAQELNEWLPAVPDAENGAFALGEAFALVRGFDDKRSNTVWEPRLLSRSEGWSPEDHALVSEYCRINVPALERAREALEFEKFRFPIDHGFGPGTAFVHHDGLRQLLRIAALNAALAAEERRFEDWPEYVELQVQLAATLEGEPTVQAQVLRFAALQSAAAAAERSLNRVPCGENVAAQLQNAFHLASSTNLLPRALIGQRALLIPVFRMSWKEMQAAATEGDEAVQRLERQPSALVWLPGWFEPDLNFFMQTMDSGISVAAFPPPAGLALTNHFGMAADVAAKRRHFLCRLLLPGMGRAAVRFAESSARTQAAAVALAIERFRLRHERLPGSLGELVPTFLAAVPDDPFDGEPFRYRRIPRGYVVNSVGSHSQDDFGGERRDLAFTVER